MPKILAYIRTSTNHQENDHQKIAIYEYARKNDMIINEIIELKVSSKRNTKDRRIDELMEKISKGDTLIVTEISRLGRSTAEVIGLINRMLSDSIRLIAIKQGLDTSTHNMHSKVVVTIFSLVAELERDLISLRTKEALAEKNARGIKLGKPVGTIQKSKFDKDLKRIKELLSLGVSIRKISKVMGYPNHNGLTNYIRKRKILDQVKRP